MDFDNQGVIVPDVSFYQDDDTTPQKIDFGQMKKAGAQGVILRSGQNTWPDEDFADYKVAAREAGLPFGYYWFLDSRSDPIKQAELWARLVGNDLPKLGIWVDLEESYHGPYRGESNWKKHVTKVQSLFPTVEVGIYTAQWWWQMQTVNDPQFWGKFPVWVAQYGVPASAVSLPRPWIGKRPVFWQFTAKGDGSLYGVESLNIDLNLFNGNRDQFGTRFGLDGLNDEPEIITEGEPMNGKVLVDLNIRATTDTSRKPLAVMKANDTVEGTVLPNGWWKLSKWTRGTAVQALPATECYAYGGASNGFIRPVTSPPPPTSSKKPFTLHVQGYKLYSGDLEPE